MRAHLRLVTETYEPDLADPVQIYLSTLAQTGRRSMQSKLEALQRALGLERIIPKELIFVAFRGRAALQDANAAPATINATISALRGVARAAWQLGLITAEEFQRVRDVRSVRGSRLPSGQAHTDEEISRLLAVCTNDSSPAGARDAAIIALGYNLGLRRAECVALDVEDYSLDQQTVKVRGKGNKERTAYIVDKGAIEALCEWLSVRSRKPGPLLCPITRTGGIIFRRITGQALYYALQRRARAAGVKNLSPHNLRKSFVTGLLDRSADPLTVRDLVGHASLNTTMIYDRRGEKGKRDAAKLIKLPYHHNRQPELPWGDVGER